MNIQLWSHIKSIVAFALLIFLTGTSLADTNPGRAEIYLAREQRNGMPMEQAATSFLCSDKIYGVVTGEWPADSEHLLEAYWTDPKGRQREHTRYNIIARNGLTRAWVWLILHRAEPDILERLLMQEDDSLREFNGQWTVDFYIDGKKITRLAFKVTCE